MLLFIPNTCILWMVFCLDGRGVRGTCIFSHTKTVNGVHKFWRSGREGD